MNLSSLMQQIAQGIQRGLRYQRYPSEALRRKLARVSSQPLFSTTVNIMPFDYNLSFGGHSLTHHNLSNGPIEDLMLESIYYRTTLGYELTSTPILHAIQQIN